MIKPIKKISLFNRERAQTMVEFALVFPIVLLITYGIIEFGRMLFTYASVNSAAREGARFGAAAGTVGGKPQYANCAEIRSHAKNIAVLANLDPVNDIEIWYDRGPDTSKKSDCPPSYATDDPNRIMLGDRIVVKVTKYYSPWISFLGINGFNISAINYRTILMEIPIPYP